MGCTLAFINFLPYEFLWTWIAYVDISEEFVIQENRFVMFTIYAGFDFFFYIISSEWFLSH